MPTPQLIRTVTVLPVHDIAEATAWYEKALGLETVYLHGGSTPDEVTNYAILVRDGVQVHLILDEPPPYRSEWTVAGRGYLYLIVRDVQAAFDEVVATGVAITRGLQTEGWGATAFLLTDPSRNEIRIEQGE